MHSCINNFYSIFEKHIQNLQVACCWSNFPNAVQINWHIKQPLQSLPAPTCGAPLRFEINTTLGCNFEIQEGDATNSIIAARLPDLLQSKTQRPRNTKTRAVPNFRCKRCPRKNTGKLSQWLRTMHHHPPTHNNDKKYRCGPLRSNSNHQDYYMYK